MSPRHSKQYKILLAAGRFEETGKKVIRCTVCDHVVDRDHVVGRAGTVGAREEAHSHSRHYHTTEHYALIDAAELRNA